MISHRPTHAYPRGEPKSLKWLRALALLTFLVLAAFLQQGWRLLLGFAVWLFTFGFIGSRLHRKLEKKGDAVRLPRAGDVVFVPGVPTPVHVIRILVLVIIAVLLFFGIAPLSDNLAHHGIIGSVIGLFALGIAYVFLEIYYLGTGRAA